MKLTPAEIRAVIALAVGMFCVQVDFFALNLALPRMAVDLNETTTNMQWVISAYMIAVGAAMIPGGRLGDLRGHSRMVVAGLAVFGGASLICGLSSSYGLLIGFRALQGLGAAAVAARLGGNCLPAPLTSRACLAKRPSSPCRLCPSGAHRPVEPGSDV